MSKIIIFSEFAQMCKIIHRELPNSLMIIGETPTELRNIIVQQFNTLPDCNILVMSSAGAYGLNLQAADTVIHYDLPWSVAKYEQRAARSHRQGQKNTVFEYSLIANKTVDGYVKKKLNGKQLISDKLMPLSELKEMLNA
jgi:SNF2 family DNA or RNA helicase